MAKKHGEPLDEAVYCKVMLDKAISGEALEHTGVKVTALRSEKICMDLFIGRVTRGPKKGMVRSFPIWDAVRSSGTAR